MAHFLTVSKAESARLVKSVHWTEEYRDRVQALLEPLAHQEGPSASKPVRGILLQNVFDGNDGLMSLIGRDVSAYPGFLISILGINQFPTTTNQFKLKLSGGFRDPVSGLITSWTEIDTTDWINCVSTALDIYHDFLALSHPDINSQTVSVGLGNPFYSPDLILYGDVVPPSRPDDAPASYIGSWYVRIDSLLGFDGLKLEAVEQQMTSLTQITVQPLLDVLSPEVTVVTDCSYRVSTFPWQVGSIASCLDYADIGFGIISCTARTIDVS